MCIVRQIDIQKYREYSEYETTYRQIARALDPSDNKSCHFTLHNTKSTPRNNYIILKAHPTTTI